MNINSKQTEANTLMAITVAFDVSKYNDICNQLKNGKSASLNIGSELISVMFFETIEGKQVACSKILYAFNTNGVFNKNEVYAIKETLTSKLQELGA